MKITAIKAQVKRVGRVSVFVDDKFSFGLSESGLLESKLAVGQEIDGGELVEFKQLAETDKLYGKSLHYTALRARSRWEIESYLIRKGASPALAETILNKLSKIGLVDDASFARSWVENRRLLRPTSRRRLLAELRAKHVASDIIEQVLAGDDTSDQMALQELIAKKRSRYPDSLKFMRYLASQGFNYDDIKTALEKQD